VNTNNNNNEVLQPEELVRRETKVVNFLRGLLLVVLIVVGAVLSFGCYRVGHKWEEQTYEREFQALASRLTDGFATAITQVMWNGYVIGATVSGSSDLVAAAPNISIPNFDQLATGAVETCHIGQVYWAPILQNETQRAQWEAYAQHQLGLASNKPQNPVCYVCGNSSLAVDLDAREVTIPLGRYTCGKR
jgi:hypothetical protein